MPTGNPLLTIIHISDLHIGEIDPVTGDARVSRDATRVFAHSSWFDGLLGHHCRALQDLEVLYLDFFDQRANPMLIVSGDITRMGAQIEFDTANSFLSAKLDVTPPQEHYVGLNYPKWRDTAIPGNHDHWPGQPVIFGGPHPAFQQYFPPQELPYVKNLPPLPNGRELQIIGINTDADIHPKGINRGRAVGSFQSQLAAAAPKLGPKKKEQIRVLLMHHSWHQYGSFLVIDRGTRAALAQFLVAHHIQLLLTGHTHDALIRSFAPPMPEAHSILECRCGTTTQHDQVPYDWSGWFSTFPQRSWPANTLLVHRLYDSDIGTQWHAQIYTRRMQRGFQPLPEGQGDIYV